MDGSRGAGQKASVVHWRVAAICLTLAGYAAGGWDRKPSVKQAKPALEALLAAERAGVIAGASVETTPAETVNIS
jgi:hypothetical protein